MRLNCLSEVFLRPGLAQCCDLNRVTQGRARAVCFDIANAAGVHPCVVQCHANGLRLTRHTGAVKPALSPPSLLMPTPLMTP